MKRVLVSLAAGLVGGTLFGFALGIFVYPFWFLNDVAMESLVEAESRTKIANGSFVHVNPADPIHWGRGIVTVYETEAASAVVHLEETFEVGPGPAFHVYIAEASDISSAGDFEQTEKFDLGRLRAFKGSQIYTVPAGISVAQFGSVVIWCEEFGVLISPAQLERDQLAMALR